MRAYHNDPSLKRRTLAQVKKHRLADELVQGQYWKDGKGCAVACLTHSPDGAHDQYPVQWGIPLVLAHLEDRIFEGLTNGKAQAWPERFLRAIPVGADLSKVTPRFLLAVVQRRYDALDAEGKKLVGPAMEQVLTVLKQWAKTGKMTPGLVELAWSAARSAESAARSAESAAWSTESAARSAASAAWSARAAEYEWMADTLVRLLREAP